MMRAPLFLALIAAPLAARDMPPSSRANPSAAIAAEIGFAQLARDRGQWTAFRETAADDGVMFVPQMVWAQDWLKGRADPPQAVRWQPHAVWASCDGSLMVTQGAWQREAAVGWFTTIWRRQDDGGYKWVLDHGDTLAEPLAAPDMIPARVADCPPRAALENARPADGDARRRPASPKRKPARKSAARPPLDPAGRGGQADDGSLAWTVSVEPDGARNLTVEWRKDGRTEPALIQQVAAPAREAGA